MAPAAWAQSTYKTLYKFKGAKDGSQPVTDLVFDTTGNLYGTTEYGGANQAGTVFKLTPSSGGGWTESVLYSFCGQSNCTDGKNPVAGLIFDAVGNLYGTTSGDGVDSSNCYNVYCGVVFELTPTSGGGWTESVLHSFTGGPDGGAPLAGLIFDATGNLYGTTWEGADYKLCYGGCGVVFELTPGSAGWTESVLHTFTNKLDGSSSWAAPLIFDSVGNLYGEAWNGGKYGYGNAFKLTPNGDGTWTEDVLHQFQGGKDGAEPQGGLIFDAAGQLYGVTRDYWSGYGIVFKLTPNSDGTWTKHTLHQFTGGKDGANPFAGLTSDKAGDLYGTTISGGADGYGVVFKLTPTSTGGWTYRVLHSFKDAPGSNPQGALVVDGAGNLYGTTFGDGGKTFGSVYEITP